jgi:hypothetical protein
MLSRTAFILSSFTAGLIPRRLLRKELFPDLLESVIPECFYREFKRDRNWPPIKTFGGDAFGIYSHGCVLIARQLAAG